jgi:hypothetical protein
MAHFAQDIAATHRQSAVAILSRVRERLLGKDQPTDKAIRRAYRRGYRWRWIRENRSALDGILGCDGRVRDLRFRDPPYASKPMNAAFLHGANTRLREALSDRVPLAGRLYAAGEKGRTDFEISVPLPTTLAADLGFAPHTTPLLTGRVRTGAKLATDRTTGARILATRPSSFGDAELDAAYAAGLDCFLAGSADEGRPARIPAPRNELRIAASLSALAVLFGHWWP